MSLAGGSELFTSYKQAFNSIIDSIKSKIEQQIPNQKGEERKAFIRAVEREIDESDEILGQTEMEILNISTPSCTRLQAKLRLYKSEAEKVKRDLVNTAHALH